MNKNLFKQQRDIARKKYFLRKYQRALDNLALHSIRSEDVETIQELIDKETPMKPRHISLLTNPPQHRTWCNNCYGVHLERAFKFCPSCGQRIDWSEDND